MSFIRGVPLSRSSESHAGLPKPPQQAGWTAVPVQNRGTAPALREAPVEAPVPEPVSVSPGPGAHSNGLGRFNAWPQRPGRGRPAGAAAAAAAGRSGSRPTAPTRTWTPCSPPPTRRPTTWRPPTWPRRWPRETLPRCLPHGRAPAPPTRRCAPRTPRTRAGSATPSSSAWTASPGRDARPGAGRHPHPAGATSRRRSAVIAAEELRRLARGRLIELVDGARGRDAPGPCTPAAYAATVAASVPVRVPL